MELNGIFEYQELVFTKAVELYKAKNPTQINFNFDLVGIMFFSKFIVVTFQERKSEGMEKQIILYTEIEMPDNDWTEYLNAQTDVSNFKYFDF